MIANYTVPHPDWAFVIVPIDTRPELRMNGRAAGKNDWFLATSQDGYVTTGENRCHIAFAVRRTRLEADCAALMGIGPEDVCLRDLCVSPEERFGDRMRRALVDVAMHSCQPAAPAGTFSISEALERDVLCHVSEQLAPLLARSPGPAAYRLQALKVVRAATERAALDSAASLADLCSAAGVSQRWLHKCFMEVTGTAPYRYLRMARLTRARDLLLSADPHETRVKQVALTVGYRLSGRFAAEYCALHGENPSDSLSRSPNA
jgi:AraC-like DNA-binding protein